MDADAFGERLAGLARDGRVPDLHGVAVARGGDLPSSGCPVWTAWRPPRPACG